MKKPLYCLLLVIVGLATACQKSKEANNEYLDYAVKTANWLKAQEVLKPEGKIWRSSDEREFTPVINGGLYNGSSGVILFYLELYHLTENQEYLKDAKAGANYLLAAIPDQPDSESPPGLYIGLSGLGFTLGEVYKTTKDERYLEGVRAIVSLLDSTKQIKEFGHSWGTNTDIISGNTGIGLFLLYAHKEFDISNTIDLAKGVANNLIEVSRDTVGGKKWMMDPSFPRYMPNFSHGTAGTAYFLASIFEITNDDRFKDAALEGGNHLLSISDNDGLVYHHDPDTTGLIYYGWCHGPPGTNRLYTKLASFDNNPQWNETIQLTNTSLSTTNLIDREPNGFWQNVGQCCGSAGVADYFLTQYQLSGQKEYFEMVEEMTNDIINHLTIEGDGVKWIHAENRSQPDFLQAQTGYAQGAAGIGLYLLKLHAHINGHSTIVRFPDSPF